MAQFKNNEKLKLLIIVGTRPEIIRQGKHVTLLFSAFQDPNNTIPCEHSEVEAFRESLQGRCRCVAYRNAAELQQRVTETLQAQLSASSH